MYFSAGMHTQYIPFSSKYRLTNCAQIFELAMAGLLIWGTSKKALGGHLPVSTDPSPNAYLFFTSPQQIILQQVCIRRSRSGHLKENLTNACHRSSISSTSLEFLPSGRSSSASCSSTAGSSASARHTKIPSIPLQLPWSQ